MSRANLTSGKLYLTLKAEFGYGFIEKAAKVAGVPEKHVKGWIRGEARAPVNLLVEIKKRDPEVALARIDRYREAARDRLDRDCQERKRRIHLARDFIDKALATADTQPKAIRQRGRGPAT